MSVHGGGGGGRVSLVPGPFLVPGPMSFLGVVGYLWFFVPWDGVGTGDGDTQWRGLVNPGGRVHPEGVGYRESGRVYGVGYPGVRLYPLGVEATAAVGTHTTGMLSVTLNVQSFFRDGFQSLRKGFQIYTAGSVDDVFALQGCERMVGDQRAARYLRDEADNLIEANGNVSQRLL